MYSIISVTNKHTAKLHHVGSLYILTYDARKIKHKTVKMRVHREKDIGIRSRLNTRRHNIH